MYIYFSFQRVLDDHIENYNFPLSDHFGVEATIQLP